MIAKSTEHYKIHLSDKRAYQSDYNKRNRLSINLKMRKRFAKTKSTYTRTDRFVSFKEEIKEGPSYVCMSCQRALFIRGVQVLDEQQKVKLQEKAGPEFAQTYTDFGEGS